MCRWCCWRVRHSECWTVNRGLARFRRRRRRCRAWLCALQGQKTALVKVASHNFRGESGYGCPTAGSPWYPAHTQRVLPQTANASHLRHSSEVHNAHMLIKGIHGQHQRVHVQLRLPPSLNYCPRHHSPKSLNCYPPLPPLSPCPSSSSGSCALYAPSCHSSGM